MICPILFVGMFMLRLQKVIALQGNRRVLPGFYQLVVNFSSSIFLNKKLQGNCRVFAGLLSAGCGWRAHPCLHTNHFCAQVLLITFNLDDSVKYLIIHMDVKSKTFARC